jgi:hypothetical protein
VADDGVFEQGRSLQRAAMPGSRLRAACSEHLSHRDGDRILAVKRNVEGSFPRIKKPQPPYRTAAARGRGNGGRRGTCPLSVAATLGLEKNGLDLSLASVPATMAACKKMRIMHADSANPGAAVPYGS